MTAGLSPEMGPVLIVGGTGGTAIGGSLLEAAKQAGLPAALADSQGAFDAPRWLRVASWRLRGRRPPRLDRFGQEVWRACEATRPRVLLATGLAPLSAEILSRIGAAGIRRVNYLTDDPWNPAHRAPWFLRALPHYDAVFSPRRANMAEIRAAGCSRVRYLPFAYDPRIFHVPTEEERTRAVVEPSDVVFAGGADADRAPYFEALAAAGLRLGLYGGYWDRYPRLRPWWRGSADPDTLRLALASAKVGVCLVRRANRDGNCMRTFEVPAVGSCMLAEDTAEHREIFGSEGERVLYFDTVEQMVQKALMLCRDDALRVRLAAASHQLMLDGGHTYAHRLSTMLREDHCREQA